MQNKMDDCRPKSIVLIGGGHAHIQVLLEVLKWPKWIQVTLVDQSAFAMYSGMVPGCLLGAYKVSEAHIDLAGLCAKMGVQYLQEKVVDIDVQNRQVECLSGHRILYDVVSLDIGSTSRTTFDSSDNDSRVVATRPIGVFVNRIENAIQTSLRNKTSHHGNVHIVIAGGGAAGIELACAINARYGPQNVQVTLIEGGSGLLRSEAIYVQQSVLNALHSCGVNVLLNTKVTRVTSNTLHIQFTNEEFIESRSISFDLLVMATGASAHGLAFELQKRGVATTKDGWIRVDPTFESINTPNLFAAGDCCNIENINVPSPPKAGVYAVRAGPILANNLVSHICPIYSSKIHYTPQTDFLKLIVTGDKEAIGIKYGIAVRSRAMWQLKDHIDKKFLSQFQVNEKKNEGIESIPCVIM